MKTQLIIFNRPDNGLHQLDPITLTPNPTINGGNLLTRKLNKSGQGLSIDLYDNISIPITFSILDIREPEKRKTSWSKTITIPGTKNNNRIFNHIYEIGADNWVTIGGISIYEGFNPNIRKEIIILNDGIQVMKGNLQMKKITRDRQGNIEYEIALNGDLTSLFYDVGTTKLSDLDFSEWDHNWSKENIQNSWYGNCKKKDDTTFTSIANGTPIQIKGVFRDESGRLGIETFTNHNLLEDDNVNLNFYAGMGIISSLFRWGKSYTFMNAGKGEFIITNVISSTKVVVNQIYPMLFMAEGNSFEVLNSTGKNSYITKRIATGKGYVYPMISWGDEYDYNSFPTTSFVPGLYIKEIFDRIMKETNSSYESNFLDSQFFKRLILIQKKESYDLTPDEINNRKFCVGLQTPYMTLASLQPVAQTYYPNFINSGLGLTYSSIMPTINPNKLPLNAETGLGLTVSYYDDNNNWNEDNYKWVVKETGQYSLDAHIRLSALIEMNGFTGAIGDGTASFTPSLPPFDNYADNWFYYPGNADDIFDGPLGFGVTGMRITAKIMRLRNGFVQEIGTNSKDFIMNKNSYWTPTNPNWKEFGVYQPTSWENITISIPSTSTYFAENDEVWIEISQYVQAKGGRFSNSTRKVAVGFYEDYSYWQLSEGIERNMHELKEINGEFYYTIESGSFLINNPASTSSENGMLQMKNVLPKDLTCKNFLLAIIKTFNLHIESDKQIERKYYIEPRNDYYYDGSNGLSDYVDWSDKMDQSSIDIIPISELTAKYYIFSNKTENDYWNEKFLGDRGREYMKYTKEIDNDFLTNESKIEIPLGSTVMINNPEGSDVVMPVIVKKESNAISVVSNSQPRMLYWGGMKPYTANRGGQLIPINNSDGNRLGWEMLSTLSISSATSSTYLQYPYAGTVDNPLDPVYDLNWYNMEDGDFVYWDSARWTNENIYNKYWANFIKEISDPASKVIVAKIHLTAKDIFDLDFRKIYVLDGNYLRLQKIIDFDATNPGLTECEFLKLKSPSKFKRTSRIIDMNGLSDRIFGTTPIGNGRVVGESLTIAPNRKKANSGFGNIMPGLNLSNSLSITVNGLSNYISRGTKNITINGNENAIGTNVTNVQIASGDGNYIAGNVKNVNIIGTDKKYITESDVSYINGVRYKNGIAISRSNVINGGTDISKDLEGTSLINKASLSTNINVINGCEDVVITNGTTTYENIINCGLNMILPDVKELGIGSSISPLPRTSLAGSYTLNIGTASFTDIIRDKKMNLDI